MTKRKRKPTIEFKIPASFDDRVRPSHAVLHETGWLKASLPSRPMFDAATAQVVQGHARVAAAKAAKAAANDPFEPPDTGGQVEHSELVAPMCPRCQHEVTDLDELLKAKLGDQAGCGCGWQGTVEDLFDAGTKRRAAEVLAMLNHTMAPFSIHLNKPKPRDP